jgi:hypothetical protein
MANQGSLEGTSAQGSGSRIRITLPAILALLAIGVIVYAMARNQDVKGVKLGDDGVEVAFASSSSLSSVEIEAEQRDLEASVRSLEERARKGARTRTKPGSGVSRNLTGDWMGSNGLAYRIEQYGNRAVISEMTPWGISAAGEGQVGRDGASFVYQAADGTSGEARFQVVNRSSLEGSFTNFVSGMTTPIRLTR